MNTWQLHRETNCIDLTIFRYIVYTAWNWTLMSIVVLKTGTSLQSMDWWNRHFLHFIDVCTNFEATQVLKIILLYFCSAYVLNVHMSVWMLTPNLENNSSVSFLGPMSLRSMIYSSLGFVACTNPLLHIQTQIKIVSFKDLSEDTTYLGGEVVFENCLTLKFPWLSNLKLGG